MYGLYPLPDFPCIFMLNPICSSPSDEVEHHSKPKFKGPLPICNSDHSLLLRSPQKLLDEPLALVYVILSPVHPAEL